ncbi:MAG: response regulator [Chloroflexi bacterium]|nr:response regulator [Chloroflexota bacterium]
MANQMPVILIADEDPTLRELVRSATSFEGYAVVEAANGGEAFRAVRDHRPAIVLVDVRLPLVNGLTVARAIKNDSKLRSTTVIVLTGADRPYEVKAGLQAGADYYVAKPGAPVELLAAIERVFEQVAA